MSQTKIIVRLLFYMVYIQTSLSFDCFASKHNKTHFFTQKKQMSPYGYQEAICMYQPHHEKTRSDNKYVNNEGTDLIAFTSARHSLISVFVVN